MKTLKTILLSNASKYIHISILVTLGLFVIKYTMLLMVLVLYLIYLYQRRQKTLIWIFIIIFMVLGVRLSVINRHQPEDLPLRATVLKVSDHHIIVKSRYKYMAYIDNTNGLKPGMVIDINGFYADIDEREINHNFNYKDYLKSQSIVGVISVDHYSIVQHQWSLYNVQYMMSGLIDQRLKGPVNHYAKAFILGDRDSLDEDIYFQAKNIGITHLFAISGMHVGLILLMINYILQWFYMKRHTHILLIGMFLFVYNMMTGFSVSIIRASLMSLIILFSHFLHIKLTKTDWLTIIFISFLIYNPFLIFYLGFQLSFLMTFVILLLGKKRASTLGQLFYISFIATIFSLPITLALNHKIGFLNIIMNPIFILMVTIFILPGIFITLLIPKMSWLMYSVIQLFETVIKQVDFYNIYVRFSFRHWVWVLSYWVLLIYIFNDHKLHRMKVYKTSMVFITLFISLSFSNRLTKVIVFDVNQGDSIYLQSGSCKMLIDTGSSDDYDAVINYLYGQNIYALDGVIITHSHEDHMGELNDVIRHLKVETLYVGKPIDIINGINQITLDVDEVLYCGRIKLKIIHAYQNDSNDNNNSLVILGNINHERWLFTGDIESVVERELIHKISSRIDHLKVAHHGSITSSNEEFLQAINPRFSYISYGKNHFGIPSKDVIERINALDSKLYTTYDSGSIEVIYLGNFRVHRFHKNQHIMFYERIS